MQLAEYTHDYILYLGINILYLYLCALIVINCNGRNHLHVMLCHILQCQPASDIQLVHGASQKAASDGILICRQRNDFDEYQIAPTTPGMPAIAMKLALILYNC